MGSLSRKPKVFVIGCNKTGTTSVAEALRLLGRDVAKQRPAELLLEDWGRRDFRQLMEFCHRHDAFQDVPFSLDWTWMALDQAFPGARFVLTVRNSGEEWFESMTRFHTRLVDKGRLPTVEDLREFPYAHPGWLLRYHELVYGADEHSLYDRDTYIRNYEAHNAEIQRYFRGRPQDLLVLNTSEPGSMQKLCAFLGEPDRGLDMPHLNVSRE